MSEQGNAPVELPPERSIRAGYEVRDANLRVVVYTLIGLTLSGVMLHVFVWAAYRKEVPSAASAAPPVEMPGEATVNQRIESIPRPRLDPLEPLKGQPPQYRSSLPVPESASEEFRPEDLRAGRWPRLQQYGWVDRAKGVAHIPVDRAMDLLVAQATKGKKQ